MRMLYSVVICGVLALGVTVQAATEAQKQAAIDAGLQYLASTQQADGRWAYGDTGSDIGATGAALLAFLEQGHTANIPGPYQATVQNGLNYLFNNARPYPIGLQPAGNPDSDGDGIGVKFNYDSSNDSRDVYATGLALPAIASTGTPGAVVTTGPRAGQTYAQVVQDTVDYFAYAQNEGGSPGPRGGWRYYANYGSSDNSTSQWPVVGTLFASKMGVSAPQFVKDELRYWVDYIQNPDGGSDYDKSWASSNVSRTGTWVMQAEFIGTDPTMVTTADLNAALAYLNSQWNTTANSTWDGNFGHPYAMWATYKGLEMALGVDAGTSVITPRPQQPGWIVDNPNHGWNWWEDYCQWLVDSQNADGSWGGYDYWTGPLATAWNVNILDAIAIPPPHGIPAPGAVLLSGIGVGLVGWLRRRRTL